MERIAQLKLQEIQKQRKRLLALYDSVSALADQQTTVTKQIEVLLEGILKKKSTLGEPEYTTSKSIHHLEVLLAQANQGTVSQDLLHSWLEKLILEITYGRSQTEFAFLFGSVLQEWAASQKNSPTPEASAGDDAEGEADDYYTTIFPKDREEFVKKVEKLFEPVPDSEVDFKYFDALLNKHREELPKSQLATTAEPQFIQKVTLPEIKAAAAALCLDNLVSPASKRSLKTLQRDDVLANEYAGVVTIMLKNYTEWDWPSEMSLKLLNNRSARWRFFFDEDIITALFLQVVGVRWGVKLKAALNSVATLIKPQHEFNAEKVDYYRNYHLQMLNFTALPSNANDISNVSEYDGGGGSSPKGMTSKQKLLQVIAAETKRIREQDRPFTITSTDIEGFYLSVPHKLVLYLMQRLGCPDSWLEFFRRFLSAKIYLPGDDGEGAKKRIKEGEFSRGLPTGHAISKVLHESLLFFCDLQLLPKRDLAYSRNFDDFYFWSEDHALVEDAWKTLQESITKAGMRLNSSKSGHLLIPSSSSKVDPAKSLLPKGEVRYGMLVMDPKGNWIAQEEGLKNYSLVMQKRLQKTTSLLSWIRAYNSHVKFLQRNLGEPSHALGSVHVQSVSQALVAIHNGVEGMGVIPYLLSQLEKRFGERNQKVSIPEAWFYWPITTGGMGLYNPFLTLTVCQVMIKNGEKDPALKFGSKAVANAFTQMMVEMKPISPAQTTELQGRIEDFKKRGSNLRGKKQSSLGVYWEWLLCNYSHQIVEKVGSLEFTDPELVPVALIQGVGSSEGDDE